MILLCGIPSEPPLAMVDDALREMGVAARWVNQRHVQRNSMELEVAAGAVLGTLCTGDDEIDLQDVQSVYARLMDHRRLPELQHETQDSGVAGHAASFHDTLVNWLDLTEARVVNRPSHQLSNGSKPFQAQLIAAHGFRIPETLITNDPAEVRRFRRERGRVVYKSISGVRSIVRELDADAESRLDRVRACPVQFQEFISGTNVRVHCVGAQVFAAAIRCEVVDYRYAAQSGAAADLVDVGLPSDIEDRCIAMTATLGLELSGIDLKITDDGRVYCFEVNPSPAYSYFEIQAGQPIARAVAERLYGSSR